MANTKRTQWCFCRYFLLCLCFFKSSSFACILLFPVLCFHRCVRVSVCIHEHLSISCTFYFFKFWFVCFLFAYLFSKERERRRRVGWVGGGRAWKEWRRETDQNILYGKNTVSKTAAAGSWRDDFKKEGENLVKLGKLISPNSPKKPGHTLGQVHLLPENLGINSAQQKEELTNKIRTILDGTVGTSAYLQI